MCVFFYICRLDGAICMCWCARVPLCLYGVVMVCFVRLLQLFCFSVLFDVLLALF